MSAVELEAGPELDLAVAEALGLGGAIEQIQLPNGEWSIPRFCRGDNCYWSPSTDLNAAFEAADKFIVKNRIALMGSTQPAKLLEGLFLGQYQDGWAIYDQDYNQMEAVAVGPTPALAICRAILKLKS